MKNIFCRILFMSVVASIIGCSDSLDDNGNYDDANYVAFMPKVEQNWNMATRASDMDMTDGKVFSANSNLDKQLYFHKSVVYGINHNVFMGNVATRSTGVVSNASDMTSFGIYAFSYSNGSTPTTPNLICNKSASAKDGSTGSIFKMDENVFWPKKGNTVDFYAYYPYKANAFTMSDESVTGVPTISYTVPSSVEDQIDILGATSVGQTINREDQIVSLNFSHVLTAITFSVGEGLDAGTITSVAVKGVHNSGVYAIGSNWTLTSSTADFTVSNLDYATGSTTNQAITSFTNGKALLMLPQTLPQEAKLEVEFKDGAGITHTLTTSIGGDVWEPGTTVDYKISPDAGNWDYVFTTESFVIPQTGGTTNHYVLSYHTTPSGGKVAVPWEITGYSTDGQTWVNTKPASESWLSMVNTQGNGGANGDVLTSRATEQSRGTTQRNANSSDIKTTIQQNHPKGSESDRYDLSQYDISGNKTSMNTANCYIINSPGYYKLPLVYGNAIKNGADNAIAYTGCPGLDYLDHPITSPYINRSGSPSSATLVWEDVNGLISNVKYESSDNGYLTFDISASTIDQGNAIVAIRDAQNRIMWSWHIWVTNDDQSASIEVTNHDKEIFNFMPNNIGWVSFSETIYDFGTTDRSVYVKVRQKDSNKESILHLVQTHGTSSVAASRGRNVYFQHGRKDPTLPITDGPNAETSTDASGGGIYTTCYTENDNYKYQLSTAGATIGGAIQHPYIFYMNDTGSYGDGRKDINPNWCTTDYANLWYGSHGASEFGYGEGTYTKTIYDPSPQSYKLSPKRSFSGFTKSGQNAASTSDINIAHSAGRLGLFYYTNNGTGNEILIPATGFLDTPHWDGTKTIRAWGGICDVWQVGANNILTHSISQGVHGNYSYGFVSGASYAMTFENNCFASLGLAVRPIKE